MSIGDLQKFLSSKSHKFRCKSPDDEVQADFSCSVFHRVTPRLSESDIDVVKGVVNLSAEHIEWLRQYGSLELFCDTKSDASAYYIAHPSQWPELQVELFSWFESLTDSDAEEFIPDWVGEAIVVGEKTTSGNYYLLRTDEKDQSKVYEFERDGFEFIEVADSFTALIQKLITVNDELLTDIGSHTRFSDGLTDTQWIPVEFLKG